MWYVVGKRCQSHGGLVRTTAHTSPWVLPGSLNKLNWIKRLLPKDPSLGPIGIHRDIRWQLDIAHAEFESGDIVEVLGWRHRDLGRDINVQKWSGTKSVYKAKIHVYG